jgi:hypothetical protein
MKGDTMRDRDMNRDTENSSSFAAFLTVFVLPS